MGAGAGAIAICGDRILVNVIGYINLSMRDKLKNVFGSNILNGPPSLGRFLTMTCTLAPLPLGVLPIWISPETLLLDVGRIAWYPVPGGLFRAGVASAANVASGPTAKARRLAGRRCTSMVSIGLTALILNASIA